MGDYLLLFLFILFLLAVFLREDFIFTVVYLLSGAFFLARWWGQKVLSSLSINFTLEQRVFIGESISGNLELENRSWFPAVWLQVSISLPPEISLAGPLNQVVSLPPKGKARFELYLEGRKRGFYQVGPVKIVSGDVLGIIDRNQVSFDPKYMIVYPKIVPLSKVPVPASSPLGTLRHVQPIYEDPARVIGKREYVAGDSLRRIDWKASASSGRLQVKKLEPSIALETVIFLNLNSEEYAPRRRFADTELAIVVAASLANWIVGQRQSVGLSTNGLDPLAKAASLQIIPPRRGQAHLMRVLESLARIEAGQSFPVVELVRRHRVGLPWGTTLILITASIEEALFDALFQAQRSGMNPMILLVGHVPHGLEIQRRARYFGIPLYAILNENDLEKWRR